MAIKDKFYQRIRKVLVKHGVLDEAKAEEAAGIADRENRSYADVLLERDMVDEMGYLSAISLETTGRRSQVVSVRTSSSFRMSNGLPTASVRTLPIFDRGSTQ